MTKEDARLCNLIVTSEFFHEAVMKKCADIADKNGEDGSVYGLKYFKPEIFAQVLREFFTEINNRMGW